MLVIWTDAPLDYLEEGVYPFIDSGTDYAVHRVTVDDAVVVPEGDVILAMGGAALKAIQKLGWCHKGRTISYMRERLIERPVGMPGTFLFSFDPRIVDIDQSRVPEIAWDVRLACRYHRTGSLAPDLLKKGYYYTDTFYLLIEHLEEEFERTGERVRVSCDLETIGFIPWLDHVWIESIQFSWEDHESLVMRFREGEGPSEEKLSEIKWILTSDKVSTWGANFKFDQLWMRVKWALKCTNFRLDTTLVGSLLNENISNSLSMHTKMHTLMGGYDLEMEREFDKGKMNEVPDKPFLTYGGGDADATRQVGGVLSKRLLSDGLDKEGRRSKQSLGVFYTKLLHPAAIAFEQIEAWGLEVDLKKYGKLRDRLEVVIEELENQALDLMPKRLKKKHEGKLQLSRAALKSDFMFTELGLNLKPLMTTPKKGDPSTAREHFKMFSDNPDAAEFIGILEEWGSATKTLGTYVDGFLSHLRPDGKFHPNYFLFRGPMHGEDKNDDGGAVTGRTSAKDPAMQTLPKHTIWATALRECFPAPPGYLFFSADWDQGELRICACVANEPTMIKAYQDGEDLHCKTAASLNGYSLDKFMNLLLTDKDLFKLLRQGGKAGNFGLIYRMGPEGFQEYAKSMYGLILTLKEAVAARDGFFLLYDRIIPWQEDAVSFAQQYGMIRSPLGRIRHLPHIHSPDFAIASYAERQAINSPVQATLSDFALWVTGIYGGGNEDLKIVGMTHDELYGYVKEDMAGEKLRELADVMGNLPFEKTFGWRPQLPFPASIEIGPSMGELGNMEMVLAA